MATAVTHDEIKAPFEAGCHECDLVVQVPALAPGSRAYCPRCGYLLTSHIPDQFQRGLALSITSLVLMAVALSFPFMSFERQGFANSMTLPQTALSLYQEGAFALSLLVAGFILLVPAVMLVLLALLMTAVLFDVRTPALRPMTRVVGMLMPWSFVEVFIIGVLVSLVKLMKMATVVLGVSFYAYIAFAVTFVAAFASVDRHDLWDAIGGRIS